MSFKEAECKKGYSWFYKDFVDGVIFINDNVDSQKVTRVIYYTTIVSKPLFKANNIILI